MTGKVIPIGKKAGDGRPNLVEVVVSTYSGHRADQRPLSFRLGEEDHVVEEILGQWLEEDERERRRLSCFEVVSDDGSRRVLCHDADAERWFLKRSGR